MALTPAERAKRYRQKVKQDAEKLKVHKEKKARRNKLNNKKIKDLTEEQRLEKRRKWREQKKNQAKNKKAKKNNKQPNQNVEDLNLNHHQNITENDGSTSASTSEAVAIPTRQHHKKRDHKLNKKYRKLYSAHKRALDSAKKYKKQIDKLRKSFSRQNKTAEATMLKMKTENEKLIARQEVMELTLRDLYKNSSQIKEKQKIKKTVQRQPKRLNKNSEAKVLGLKFPIRMRPERKINKQSQEELEEFFNRDDISRMTAGKRETKTKAKKKAQIRYLVDTLKNLHEIYKKEGGKLGFTTFCKGKPYYVLSPSVQRRETCLCIKHSNMEFMFNALKKKGVVTHRNVEELLVASACDTKTYDCMYNKCEKCKTIAVQHSKNIVTEEEDITWHKWVRINHNYKKNGKQFTTKKTIKQQTNGTISKLIAEIQKELPSFKTHYFNWKEQQRQYRNCINNLKDEEVVILCDFSENYECKYSEEIQSTHFGASKNSITLHTGMIVSKDMSQSFVTISDHNCHEPHAIWAHLMPVIRFAKTMNPKLKVVHFFSDGPSSQYRQKKNFYLLSLFTAKLKLSYSTWSYSEAGHGKSMADGIGGSVKRSLDKRVTYGHDIMNANDAYSIMQERASLVKSFLISDNDIDNFKSLLPDTLQAVPGTMQLHQITTDEQNLIKYRQLSCFCGEERGLCNCHSPKTHIFEQGLVPKLLPVPAVINVTTSKTSVEGEVEDTQHVEDDLKEASSQLPPDCNTPSDEFPHDFVAFDCEKLQIGEHDFDCDIDFKEINGSPTILSVEQIDHSTLNVPGSSMLKNREILDQTIDIEYLIPHHKISPVKSDTQSNPFREADHFDQYLDCDPELTELYDSLEISSIKQIDGQIYSAPGPSSNSQTAIDIGFPVSKKEIRVKIETDSKPSKKAKILNTVTVDDEEPWAKKAKVSFTKKISERNPMLTNKGNKPKRMSSRSFICLTCKSRQAFNLKAMVKCMVCSNWVCFSCSGTTFFDFICATCLGA